MAVDSGRYSVSAVAGYGTLGLFAYEQGVAQSSYFAGEFFIDTGYNDPVAWTAGVNAAEIYGARVYPKTGTSNMGSNPSDPTNVWALEASPVWSAQFYRLPAGAAASNRVLIRVEAFVRSPVTLAAGKFTILESVDWTLYRI